MLKRFRFSKLVWLLPILTIVHNLEEAPWMISWIETNRYHLPGVVADIAITTQQFWAATIVIDLAVLYLAYSYYRYQDDSLTKSLLFLVASVFFVNGLSHVTFSLWTLSIQPGTITGVLLNIPFTAYFMKRALKERQISQSVGAKLFFLGVILMGPLAGLFLLLGGIVR